MRVLWLVMFFGLLGVLNPAVARESTSNLRLLLHGQVSDEPGWTAAGWVVMPNAAKSGEVWLVLAGPRYNGAGWGIELLGGELVVAQEPALVIDVRLTPPQVFGLNMFINPRLIDPAGENIVNVFAQVNYALPGGFARLGVESEDVIDEDYAGGPQVVVPLGRMVLTASYQWHNQSPDQIWARALLNF